MKHKDTNALTRKERTQRDNIVGRAHAAKGDIDKGERELARYLQEIQEKRLYREGGLTLDAFTEATFGLGRTETFNLIAFANVCDVLEHAGVAPLAVKSHALDIVKLQAPEIQVTAVQHGRELAEREGKPLTARHLKEACSNVVAMLGSLTAFEPPASTASEVDRAAVQDYTGLLVVLPDASLVDPAELVASVPGGLVVPYNDAIVYPPPSERPTDAQPFARAKIDDLTDLVWSVLTPSPWSAAESWALPPGEFHGVFYPGRLSAPQSRRASGASDRELTVLACPGTDLFHPAVHDRVVQEVIDAAGADPSRRYLIRTDHPSRAWEDGWPANVFVVVEAVGTAAAVDAAGLSLGDLLYERAIIIRDLVEPLLPDAICAFSWVLVRGAKTTQKAYQSILKAIDTQQAMYGDMAFDRGDEVKARHSSYPALPASGPDPA